MLFLTGFMILGSYFAAGYIAAPESGMANPPGEHCLSEKNLEMEKNLKAQPTVILFFGNSITAGYGLDLDQAFPSRVGAIADSLGYHVEIINAGVSGETSAGGLRRVSWVLQRPIDIFVLELGANDGLRGIDPSHTLSNLQAIINRVFQAQPEAKVVLTGMEAPPNMGTSYVRDFRNLYSDLAESNEVVFMPFILEDVAGIPELNLPDGIHPTYRGHHIIARNLWPYLEPLLNKKTDCGHTP